MRRLLLNIFTVLLVMTASILSRGIAIGGRDQHLRDQPLGFRYSNGR